MSDRLKTNLFKIDGLPMVAPDQDAQFSYEDIDSADTGRDETGRMHRSVVLYKVGKWAFTYNKISNADYEYMEQLFGNKAEFKFTRPDRSNPDVMRTTMCYRSKYGMVAHNIVKKEWLGYAFDIIEMDTTAVSET